MGVLVIGALGEDAIVPAAAVGKVVAFALFGTLATFRIPGPHDVRIGLRGFSPRLILPMLLLLPVVVVLSELDNWILALLPVPSELSERLEEATADASRWTALQQAIVVVGLLPVVDEWFFRGVIQQGLIAHKGHVAGVLLTAILFAPSHASPVPAAGAVVSALGASVLLGVVLGLLRIASGSLLAPMAFHAVANGVSLLAILHRERFPIEGFSVADTHTDPWLVAASVVSVAMGLRLLWPHVRAGASVPPLPRDAAGPLGPGRFDD